MKSKVENPNVGKDAGGPPEKIRAGTHVNAGAAGPDALAVGKAAYNEAGQPAGKTKPPARPAAGAVNTGSRKSIFQRWRDFQEKAGINYILLFSVGALVLIGLVFVYSASSYTAELQTGNKYYFLIKQATGAAVGAACLFGVIFFPIKKIEKWSPFLYIASLVMLALVFIPGIGMEKYGARRWLGWGGFSIQPSELAKFAYVIFAAAFMAKRPAKMKKFSGFLLVGGMGLAVCVLIILEPNMSITVCMALITFAMLFIGGAKFKHMLAFVAPVLAAVPVLILMEPYRVDRLIAFLDPWASPKDEGYQLIQSLYALGSGGWFGVGLFNSRQKFSYLPFAESDFIFAVIGEETGFVGAAAVLLLFVAVVFQGVKIARRAPDRFQCYLAAGISCVIAIQTLINIAVVTGSIPPTGLPLPFVSSGGSSLVVFMTGAGILLNIDRNRHAGKPLSFKKESAPGADTHKSKSGHKIIKRNLLRTVLRRNVWKNLKFSAGEGWKARRKFTPQKIPR